MGETLAPAGHLGHHVPCPMRSPYQRQSKRRPAPSRRGASPLKPSRRRVLEMLAASPEGLAEGLLAAHGVTIEQMIDLVRAGLATATAERIRMGPRTIAVARVRITEAGRKVLGNERRRG